MTDALLPPDFALAIVGVTLTMPCGKWCKNISLPIVS
jgi:hypothetical protein